MKILSEEEMLKIDGGKSYSKIAKGVGKVIGGTISYVTTIDDDGSGIISDVREGAIEMIRQGIDDFKEGWNE
ncbi:hypothetical protein [Streptobacillus moniliformis]|uniref:hypothetical protein n=1 Tax=Streptobacillus moniliformis TaxID=34105 RepID=UPI0007E3D85E|nr:hypothetical protein [Streptobacillus moniliformis]